MTSRERDDLLATLAHHRTLLRHTANGLTDEQAATRSTVSELCVGGVIKHVTRMERRWTDFLERGPVAFGSFDAEAYAAHAASFRMEPGETLEGLLAEYAETAAHTDDVVAGLSDLNADGPLPVTPWWPEGTRWTARRVLLHVIAETAQHAGHADIVREAIDGQKTMG
ncbi:MAG TPA: DinB family protein [Sporichthyaceae bacterium]|jgi:uncharacterized damage-inducible protein DinB